MHNSSFVIKVADLLRNPGKLDFIVVDNLWTDKLDGLNDEGISLKIALQWVSDWSVKVTIEEAKAIIRDVCDLSWEEYDRIVSLSDRSSSYSQSVGMSVDDKVYDDEFPFASEHETIDLEDFIVQSIQLEKPLVSIKPWKEYLLDEFESEEDDENNY